MHLSTVGVYGRPRRLPCAESAPVRPRQAYEETKARGEAIAREAPAPLAVTVLRPTIVYGPFSRYGFGVFLGTLYLALARGRASVPGLRRGPRLHAVHVHDVARAVAFVLPRDAAVGGIYNVADDTPTELSDVFALLAAELGLATERRIPYQPVVHRLLLEAVYRWLPERRLGALNRATERRWRRMAEEIGFEPAFVPRLDRDWLLYASAEHVYDNRALARLGFTYRFGDLRAGLRQTVRWYLDHRWLPAPDEVRRWAAARRAGARA